MSRAAALLGSGLLLILAPGTVAGLIPYLITGWRFSSNAMLVAFGSVLLALAAVALIECFLRFALTAAGTPAPAAPTQKLVVTGLYRRTRNPMYVAVLGLIGAQALMFESPQLALYGGVVWLAFHIFVVGFEEKRLAREFPDQYPSYAANVPRWRPRLIPWRG